MKTAHTYQEEHYGLILISQEDNKSWNIWWDPWDEMEGFSLCDAKAVIDEPEGFYKDVFRKFEIKDFDDLPDKPGYAVFKTSDDAKKYMEKKLKITLK